MRPERKSAGRSPQGWGGIKRVLPWKLLSLASTHCHPTPHCAVAGHGAPDNLSEERGVPEVVKQKRGSGLSSGHI